jgi:peptide deformylase
MDNNAMIKKYVTALLTALLLNINCYGQTTGFAINNNTLTPAEWQLLQIRVKQQNTDVITTALTEQQQLLQSTSRTIDAKTAHLDVLIEQMRKAMLAHEGTGLTAVQIGIPVRVVIMQRTVNGVRLFHSFINPELIRTSPSKANYQERCLSIPDVHHQLTERAVYLTIRYQKTDGHVATETFTGMDAAIFQQEMDHLNGVLLTDHHLVSQL